MEVKDIFKAISSHQVKGIMLHTDMADYFDFLNLKGYKRMEEYYAKKEMRDHRRLHRYYIGHYDKLIPTEQIPSKQNIPLKWFEHSKQDVDINTKRTSVKTAFTNWVSWERETKKLYQQMYKELVDLGEIDSSLKLGKYVKDASEELEKAESMLLNLSAVDFAMDCILDVQQQLHDEYKNKQ